MMNRILDKYTQLKSSHSNVLEKEKEKVLIQEQEVLKHFLILYDNDVKKIHSNQMIIEKDLQQLYSDTKTLNDICKQGLLVHDDLVEYFKEAGDLFNWCTILEAEMNEVNETVIDTLSQSPNQDQLKTEEEVNTPTNK